MGKSVASLVCAAMAMASWHSDAHHVHAFGVGRLGSLSRINSPLKSKVFDQTIAVQTTRPVVPVGLVLYMTREEEESESFVLDENDSNQKDCWNPGLRKVMGGLASMGAIETAYLTYIKLWSDAPNDFCSTGGDCGSVILNSPYATISLGPDVSIPLSALGFVAYTLVAGLAVVPLVLSKSSGNNKEEGVNVGDGNVDVDVDVDVDVNNRLALVALTTVMATVSSFLLSLLFGVLHATCPYCLVSAGLSMTLGVLAWAGGAVPPSQTTRGAQLGAYSVLATTAAALAVFSSVVGDTTNDVSSLSSALSVASANDSTLVSPSAPPAITTTSSKESLALAKELKQLDAKMYGAFWCSHCYDQKQTFGKEAMQQIPYIECAKDGLNSQTALCKEHKVPGYPTWEIGGQLYPGEQEIEELQEVVQQQQSQSQK
eukprot:scaffold61205_cov53-Attheya_sp.AAC.2